MRRPMRASGLALFLAVVAAAPGRVCNIPVFRYALERWPSEPYIALVFHRGPLDPESEKLLLEVRRTAANLAVEKVEVDGTMDPTVRKVWESQKDQPLPWVSVLYPNSDPVPAWSGRLEASSFRALADSPARKEMVKRIMSGESAVWLLVESGDRPTDDAAAAMLAAELPRLEKTLKIPELGEDDPPLRSSLPLRVKFSILRLSRADEAERVFLATLLRGYKEPKGAVVIPVIGRARAVWALAGEAVKGESVADLAEFVTGACSCEVKELNPGMDLLVTADWEALLDLGGPAAEPAPLSIPAPVLPPPRAPEPPAPVPAEPPPGRAWLWVGLAGAAAAVLVTGLNVLNAFRRRA
jgi:hypothetical protein